MLKLGQTYSIDKIETLVEENNLYEKINGLLEPFNGDGGIGEIGEATLPLYFEDETVACNFILTGYSTTSFWRCIYVCQSLEE